MTPAAPDSPSMHAADTAPSQRTSGSQQAPHVQPSPPPRPRRAPTGFNPRRLVLLNALGVALLVGAINGVLIAYAGMPAFVVTLGMLSAARSALAAPPYQSWKNWAKSIGVCARRSSMASSVASSSTTGRSAGVKAANSPARCIASASARVEQVLVRDGDRVEQGQRLLRLWDDDLEAQLRLAQRDVEAAGARAEETCAEADVACRESKLVSKLRERGLSSEEDADVASGHARASAAACRAMRSNVGVAQARVEVAVAALERMRLVAPFDGIVAEVNGELGEFVTPSPVGP